MFKDLADLVQSSKKIVILMANNPDGDSLASALALEEILIPLKKEVRLYCRAEIPHYLRFLDGWQRFENNLHPDYDLAIMVDNSAKNLIDDDGHGEVIKQLRLKPLVILDHHSTVSDIDFSTICINQPEMVSTGQLIYTIAKELDWPLNKVSVTFLATSILSDSLGFTSQVMLKNSQPLRVMAELVDLGVDLSDLAQRRLEWQKIPADLVDYRGQLLQRIEFYENNQVALLVIEHDEIKKLGSLYNPTIVLDEMRLVEGMKICLGFKKYLNPAGQLFRVTLRIRCYHGCQIAQKLAEMHGGGGHPYAAGAKWEGDLDFDQIKDDVLKTVNGLLLN